MDYITKQDYLNFSGIDLDIELKKGNYDNPTKAVEIFIKRIQDWCVEYLTANYFTTIEDVETNSDEFKKGVLHQIDYVRRNGELSIEATNITRVMSPNAKNVFMNIGLCNTRQERYYGYRR